MFDTDHDLALSAEEIQAASGILAKMDKNGDGKLTLDEIRPPDGKKGDKPKGPKGPDDRMARLPVTGRCLP